MGLKSEKVEKPGTVTPNESVSTDSSKVQTHGPRTRSPDTEIKNTSHRTYERNLLGHHLRLLPQFIQLLLIRNLLSLKAIMKRR